MLSAITLYFGHHVEVISQAAGLHITLRWQGKIDEETLRQRALNINLILRTLSYYQPHAKSGRDWHGVVLGFGNTPLEQIPVLVEQLANEFFKNN
ncbi:hypothetical protein VSF3289_04231 [Vibrio scophthalmi]|uniref:Uncharacterized protein n=2 Tax=Vibrio scophthalmi TaxID=45658 RepID=A0A1E3WH38_9VIBR|nr:hypothetical protein VSF3289_04231 [Vibrio scophthalmi]